MCIPLGYAFTVCSNVSFCDTLRRFHGFIFFPFTHVKFQDHQLSHPIFHGKMTITFSERRKGKNTSYTYHRHASKSLGHKRDTASL